MKKLSALGLSASLYLTAAVPAFAAGGGISGTICPSEPNASGVMNFNPLCDLMLGNNVVGNILNVVFIVAVIIALAFLIYGGIKWVTSGGDKTKVEGARNTIVAALIGLVLVFLAYFILQIVFALFGLDFNQGNFFAELNVFR
ncbi:MAG: hypothetical protein A3A51_03750 [Candidatus Levybacteria bacterium RIFCSPLOWO2_01_FULL_39_10]|nr:MAG: hypothetical protein A3A51_03750 [Candidatus Levybacteria bacterium RIFCSPLOWO2_01_FULL_39_10]